MVMYHHPKNRINSLFWNILKLTQTVSKPKWGWQFSANITYMDCQQKTG